MKPKFSNVTRKQIRNLVMEVEAQTRKLLLQQKVKLGWLICKTVTTWLQTDVLNVPDLNIDFASAEERKPTLCA